MFWGVKNFENDDDDEKVVKCLIFLQSNYDNMNERMNYRESITVFSM